MRPRLAFLLALSTLLCIHPLAAQAPPTAEQEPLDIDVYRDRLPEGTFFVLRWKNLGKLEELRSSNPLLRLLDSPEMKANWRELKEFHERQRAQRAAGKPDAQPSSSKSDIDLRELLPLLTNPGFIAVVAPAAGEREPAWLLLYDASNKEEVLSKLEARSRKPGATTRQHEFEGIRIEENINKEGKTTSYEAHLGRWLVAGENRKVLEAWLGALQRAPERSLKDVAYYQRARTAGDSQVELIYNIPLSLKNLPSEPPAKPGAPTPEKIFGALGLDVLELLRFQLNFEPSHTNFEVSGVFTGENPRLLALFPLPVADFASSRLAPENAFSFSAGGVDLPATLAYLNHALETVLPPEQTPVVGGVRGMLEATLGIPLEEFFAALGPEYAQFTYEGGSDHALHSVYALELSRPETVLGAVRNFSAAGTMFATVTELPREARPDTPIYFRISAPTKEDSKQEGPAFFLAVTPKWLLASERREEIAAAVERMAGGPSIRNSATYREARSRFPQALTGFGFADADRWLASEFAQKFVEGLAEAIVKAAEESDKKPAEPSEADVPTEENPAAEESEAPKPEPPKFVIPRGYLKWVLTATTRDANSFRVTGIIE